MTAENAKVVAGFVCTGLEHEFPTTKKVLAAVPDGKLGWRPHDKGRTAGELAWHIAAVDIWFLESVARGSFPKPEVPPHPKTSAEIVAYYDKNFPAALAKVKALSGEQLLKEITFHSFNQPGIVFVNLANCHSIHHRGQLAAYLRTMGEKVPSIYGGSADEPMG